MTLAGYIKDGNTNVRYFGYFSFGIVGILLLMLAYSWVSVLFMNPGYLIDEISKRGDEQIRECPHCKVCGLCKPMRCHHCSQCGKCVLLMDHHCDLIGKCLAFRNFKAFILVMVYGALASGYGVLVMIFALFYNSGFQRIVPLVYGLFLAVVSMCLIWFAQIYLKMNHQNTTTIEQKFPTLQVNEPELKTINMFGTGIDRILPTPNRINPFEY